ncbi:MAG TPA: YfiR/HmsC family protein [Anaeromyxobacteraceae bacterium]|nr:YfiR/HmsC family protein [Anaeromyxobacteraceae bacterium]
MLSSRPATALLLAALVALPWPVQADDLAPRKQALLLLRVLVYDRNLKSRAGNSVRVAVAFRASDRESEKRRDELVSAFEQVSREVVAAGLPVEVVAVPYRDATDFEARLAAAHPSALYACVQLEPAAGIIARMTRRLHILSAAGSRFMPESGLAIGLVSRGQRAAVIVNLRAAKGEGADLDAALLSIAEVLP